MGIITRSIGLEVPDWVGPRPGGGYCGINKKLDAAVERAAKRLEATFDVDVEIRFNSDRLSGGAFVKRTDGATVGITYAWASDMMIGGRVFPYLAGPKSVTDKFALRYPSAYPKHESLICFYQNNLQNALVWLEENVNTLRLARKNGQL